MQPQVNYVVNEKGTPVFVQISVQDWEAFLEEHNRLRKKLGFRARLTAALEEVNAVQNGQKTAISLNQFLDEL
jgi:PHD/YefM family antitoxin component YafN of YafNO toxin-antitoxin module